MNDNYVTIPQAKQLRLLGYPQDLVEGVRCRLAPGGFSTMEEIRNLTAEDLKNLSGEYYEVHPTYEEVRNWLYKNHNIWIVVNFANKNQFYFDVKRTEVDQDKMFIFKSNYDYTCPGQALKAGVTYVLEREFGSNPNPHAALFNRKSFLAFYFNPKNTKLEYGKYIVELEDGTTQLLIYNGTGWANYHNKVKLYYLPKFK